MARASTEKGALGKTYSLLIYFILEVPARQLKYMELDNCAWKTLMIDPCSVHGTVPAAKPLHYP